MYYDVMMFFMHWVYINLYYVMNDTVSQFVHVRMYAASASSLPIMLSCPGRVGEPIPDGLGMVGEPVLGD